jgi:hypothetical protein
VEHVGAGCLYQARELDIKNLFYYFFFLPFMRMLVVIEMLGASGAKVWSNAF